MRAYPARTCECSWSRTSATATRTSSRSCASPQWQALPDRDAAASAIKRSVNDVAHALGGTFSAEHGIGRTLLGEMACYKPAVELELMRSIKQALDPHNLFNPGRLLPARSPIAVPSTQHQEAS